MSDDVLLRFVTRNLIDVGGDDTKLTNLRHAAGDLSGILKETPAKTLAFSLAAFDPEVPESDPSIAEAADALRKRWETYANTFATVPVAVCRAMLLDALIQASRGNEAVAIGFATSARNVLPFIEVGREQEIWAEVVTEIERGVEERAEAEWATPASIDLPKLTFDAISLTESRVSDQRVNENELAKKIFAAAGPSYYSSEDGGNHSTDGNKYFPNQDGHWVYEFGTRTATAITELIDGTVERLSVEGMGLSEAHDALADAISVHLTRTTKAVIDTTMSLQRRADLLWWKEARFSPSSRKSYREMEVSKAAALMAFDMHQQIPAFSPASVAAFLWEAVISLPNGNENQKSPIRKLVEDAGQTDELAELRKEAARLVITPTGRGPLLGLIAYPEVLSQIDDRGFLDLVGIRPEIELNMPDWSVYLLREFQAARAVTEVSTPKRVMEGPAPKRRTTSRKRASRK